MTFPNPCPVCGANDEHAAWLATIKGSPATLCPHPAERGHGTGCCCAGRSTPLSSLPLVSGTGHDRTGSKWARADLGRRSKPLAWLEAITWAGCNGQMCARDCGPGHHVVLWVPCNFAVGGGHHITLADEEIAALRDVLDQSLPFQSGQAG